MRLVTGQCRGCKLIEGTTATYDDDADDQFDDHAESHIDGTGELGDDIDAHLDVGDDLSDDGFAVAALGIVALVCGMNGCQKASGRT